MPDARENADHLIDRLPEAQLAALVGLLETIVDPVSRALANAPIDDEPVTEEEEQAVASSKDWFRHNPGTPFEQVVAELGFTMEQVGKHAQEEQKDLAA
ncbi:MAG: hypothetical protein WB579_20380 [Bryobacteraceae bacterium]